MYIASSKLRYRLRASDGLDKCLSDQLRAYVFYDFVKVDDQQRFEVDGLSPEVVTANQRACEVRMRGKGWEPRYCYYQVTR